MKGVSVNERPREVTHMNKFSEKSVALLVADTIRLSRDGSRRGRPSYDPTGSVGLPRTMNLHHRLFPYPFSATAVIDGQTIVRQSPLQVTVLAAGTTTLAGRILATKDDAPIPGARVKIGALSAITDASGNFLFSSAPAGSQVLLIDGPSALYPGDLPVPVTITEKKRGQATLISEGVPVGAMWIQVPAWQRVVVASRERQTAVGG